MLVRDPKRLAPYVQQLKEYFAGTRRVFDVPIDISEFGTEFQRRVLQAVQRIPCGATNSLWNDYQLRRCSNQYA